MAVGTGKGAAKIRIKKKRSLLRLKLFTAAVVISLAFFGFDARIRPMIETYAVSQAANHVTEIINESINSELEQSRVSYSDIINITYNQEGMVSALQTNMIELNRLQSGITRRIIDDVLEFDSQTIYISLGALLGGPLLSGRGPDMPIRLIPSNFIQTRVTNNFESSGINQTRHQLIMEINLTVTAVMPGYQSTTTVETNVVLAETVIVGGVPDAFTKVSDGTDPLVGMIQDYGAVSPSE